MKHNIEEIRESWHDILDKLIDETNFDKFLSGEWDYFHWHLNSKGELPENISGTSGATRMCFWDETITDVVYKISIDRNDIDYGASEVYIYEKAKESGLERWFAWTALIDTIDVDGIITKIYAMDYCFVDGDELEIESSDSLRRDYCYQNGLVWDNMSPEEREEVYDAISCDEGTSTAMECYLYDHYGTDPEVGDLINFLWDYNVNDTHCGNWGYLNNQLVLIDYGGYEKDLIKVNEQREY